MTLADKFFHVQRRYNVLENELVTGVLVALGFRTWPWPFDDITFDDWDSSCAFKGARLDFDLTEKQQNKLWELGFDRCWIGYINKTEKYYWKAKTKSPCHD